MATKRVGEVMLTQLNRKIVLPIDQFDAVCDEFLKAFEQIDVKQSGVIDVSGFKAFKRLLSGGNLWSMLGRFNQRKTAVLSDVDQAVSSVTQTTSAEIYGVDSVDYIEPEALTGLAYDFFCQRRSALLEMSFEQLDSDNQGVIEAWQILKAIHLDSAAGYLRSIYSADTKITDALWPTQAHIADHATSKEKGFFEEVLYPALRRCSANVGVFDLSCQRETA